MTLLVIRIFSQHLMNYERNGSRSDFYVRYAWLTHVFMEAVDEQNDWIPFHRTIDGSYLRGLRR